MRAPRRSAKYDVNTGGMCWTTSTGTGSPRAVRRAISVTARGPPVEAPIATTSMRAGRVRARTTAAVGRSGVTVARGASAAPALSPHSALMRGISSLRTCSTAVSASLGARLRHAVVGAEQQRVERGRGAARRCAR